MDVDTQGNAASMPQDIAATWSLLEAGLEHEVLANKVAGITYARYMQLYDLVYNYCTQSTVSPDKWQEPSTTTDVKGEQLYVRLREYLYEHLRKVKAELDATPDAELLQVYCKYWQRFTTAAIYTSHLFRYLNRVWIPRYKGSKSEVYEVHTLALVIWLDVIFDKSAPLHGRIIDEILRIINRERKKEVVDTSYIKRVCESLVELGSGNKDNKKSLKIYQMDFEEKFVDNTLEYYTEFSENFINQNSVSDYLKMALDKIAEEENRVQLYLDKTTRIPVVSACERSLISAHVHRVTPSFKGLLEEDKIEDLSKMFIFLRRVDKLDDVKSTFGEHVKSQGLLAVSKVVELAANPGSTNSNQMNDDNDDEDEGSRKKAASAKPGELEPKTYVDALLGVYNKYNSMVEAAFSGDPRFTAALDIACREFINRNAACRGSASKSPELLAKYCDVVLKKSSKISEEQAIESALDDVMTVFKYIEDKDVFQKFYQKTLAKRLVLGMFASEISEELMISKLKAACGYEFTSKLTRMFSDLRISRELNTEFRTHLKQLEDKEDMTDFNILVGGTAQWPLTSSASNFNLPAEISKMRQVFEEFYLQKHRGRKLNWLFHLGKVEVRANYCKVGKVPCTFILTNYQLGILLPYNDRLTYTWSELLELTGLSEDVFTSQIKTLIKAKLLLMEGKIGAPDSKYELNLKLQSKKVRMKLDHPVRSEQKQEAEDTLKTLEEDRKLLIQAAIVRIMKTRKVMPHAELMSEVISQLNSRFKLRVPDIKRCIDILLEKEYIERSSTQKDLLEYVA